MISEAEELAQVLAAIRAAPSMPPGATIAEMRAGVDAMMAAYPVRGDVRAEPGSLGGVPCLHSAHLDAGKDRAILFLHGGGYVLGSAAGYRALEAELSHGTRAQVWAADYRLAPEHPFPAAIEDALAAYRGLLDQGLRPGQIAVAGDSAGGGLALALLIAARDSGLPLPACCFAMSPWFDLTNAAPSRQRNRERDPNLTLDGLATMAAGYLAGLSPETPLASPLFANLAGLPPLLVQTGTAEILLDDTLRLAARAAEADVSVSVDLLPHMFHGWYNRWTLLRVARAALDRANTFLAAHFEMAAARDAAHSAL